MNMPAPTTPEEKAAFVEQALQRAEELRRAHSHNEGIHLLVDALQYGLEKARIYHRLGNLYVDAGDLGRAEYAYKRALDVDPGHANAMHNLAIVYKRQKKVSLFVKTYKKAQRMEIRALGSKPTLQDATAHARRWRIRIIAGILGAAVFLLVFLLLRR